MLAAPSLPGRLPQEIRVLGELAEKLVVQIVSVCEHDDGGRLQRILQQAGIEHRRQGLSAALNSMFVSRAV